MPQQSTGSRTTKLLAAWSTDGEARVALGGYHRVIEATKVL
jgi:hypothetical protein